jgi:hypothetical protein
MACEDRSPPLPETISSNICEHTRESRLDFSNAKSFGGNHSFVHVYGGAREHWTMALGFGATGALTRFRQGGRSPAFLPVRGFSSRKRVPRCREANGVVAMWSR